MSYISKHGFRYHVLEEAQEAAAGLPLAFAIALLALRPFVFQHEPLNWLNTAGMQRSSGLTSSLTLALTTTAHRYSYLLTLSFVST